MALRSPLPSLSNPARESDLGGLTDFHRLSDLPTENGAVFPSGVNKEFGIHSAVLAVFEVCEPTT